MSSIVKLPRITAVGLCLILGVTHNASFAFAFQRSTVVTHRSFGKAGLFRYRSDHNGSESTEVSDSEIERLEELTASLGKWEDELNDEIEKLVNEKISSNIAAMKHEMCVDLKDYIQEATGKLDDKIHKNSMKIIDHEHKNWMEMYDFKEEINDEILKNSREISDHKHKNWMEMHDYKNKMDSKFDKVNKEHSHVMEMYKGFTYGCIVGLVLWLVDQLIFLK